MKRLLISLTLMITVISIQAQDNKPGIKEKYTGIKVGLLFPMGEAYNLPYKTGFYIGLDLDHYGDNELGWGLGFGMDFLKEKVDKSVTNEFVTTTSKYDNNLFVLPISCLFLYRFENVNTVIPYARIGGFASFMYRWDNGTITIRNDYLNEETSQDMNGDDINVGLGLDAGVGVRLRTFPLYTELRLNAVVIDIVDEMELENKYGKIAITVGFLF